MPTSPPPASYTGSGQLPPSPSSVSQKQRQQQQQQQQQQQAEDKKLDAAAAAAQQTFLAYVINRPHPSTGLTALAHAVISNSAECVTYLLEDGADMNRSVEVRRAATDFKPAVAATATAEAATAITITSSPLLHLASEAGATATLRLLILRGADEHATNSNGETAADVACRNVFQWNQQQKTKAHRSHMCKHPHGCMIVSSPHRQTAAATVSEPSWSCCGASESMIFSNEYCCSAATSPPPPPPPQHWPILVVQGLNDAVRDRQVSILSERIVKCCSAGSRYHPGIVRDSGDIFIVVIIYN